MQAVYSASNLLDAQIVRDALIDAGVPAIILGEFLSMGRGELPMTSQTLPCVWVAQGWKETALGVVQRVKHDLEHPERIGTDWTCACGQWNASQFSQCWRCLSERPEWAYGSDQTGSEDEDD
jgi:hypothetical protein